jgi:glyoxalase family protein
VTGSAGLHHVTAIAGDPRRDLDFYSRALGQRLVKRTVNFDDPHTYHFYFGDEAGTPGSLLTFFPWPGARAGRPGSGEVAAVAYAVPARSLDGWRDRLALGGAAVEAIRERFGARALVIRDPAGLRLELIERPAAEGETAGDRPGEPAIRALDSVTLTAARPDATAALLIEVLGFAAAGEEAERRRFSAASGASVELVPGPAERSRLGPGSVHHVAFRARDDAHLAELREALLARGLHVTAITDRLYFRSIYFREPGGVLFEIATDGPGFAVDEPRERLGEGLMLPPWLEPQRESIAAALPPMPPAFSGRA